MPKKKIAVVLMNLGGPDSLTAVRPFLYNLFSDPAIIRLPFPLRQVVAWLIAKRRYQQAEKIYAQFGGKSPLLENTQNQANALEEALANRMPEADTKVFIAMRYWHPLTQEASDKVRDFTPDEIVLLPLYPQFSTTTTASSLALWRKLFRQKEGTKIICCYPEEPGFIAAYQDLIRQTIAKVPSGSSIRLLFSAHGLPQKIIDQGDPYEAHIHQSVAAIMTSDLQDYDYQICYQSRVGPLKWLGPSLEEAMQQAAVEKKAVVVVPVSFVSEHSETLVELDIDFQNRANALNIPYYGRVPTVSCHPHFIGGLANMVMHKINPPIDGTITDGLKIGLKCWCNKND